MASSRHVSLSPIVCRFNPRQFSADTTRMAYTIEQYEATKKAYANGVASVTYGDKTVSYRSLDEMERIIKRMEAELFPERVPRRRRYASVGRGYFGKK